MVRLIAILCILLTCGTAHAVKIADITRLSGQRTNTLTGLGLVFGLRGTGDGGDFAAAIKPMATMLAKFQNEVTVRELANVQNVAVVMVTATVPASGVRDGDKIDCYVTSIGAAASLRGGRLFIAPLMGPMPGSGIFALAEGPITIEDPANPLHGVVKGGCVMETNIPMRVIDPATGQITLILEDPAASWTTASTIAKIINDAEGDGEILAVAEDQKTVVVTIPRNELQRPDSFISRVQQLPVRLLPTEARVVINERTGTITMTGDVEISPVVISHQGLTITTINPAPVPTPRNPVLTERTAIGLDTTRQGGARLRDLVDAMDMIKVPTEDRIAIIRELYKTGKLHAKLMEE
jgi:flagellar P-ring protein FlgI